MNQRDPNTNEEEIGRMGFSAQKTCPSCSCKNTSMFHRVDQVPVHSVLLMTSRDMALNYPKGDIALALCGGCGFIWNTAFDARLLEYSTQYEETQAFSPTFATFHQQLAASLIERYDLRKKVVLEIGCGKGDFISLLCQMGENSGIGFDPAYISTRNASPAKDRVTFVQDFYSEKHGPCGADFVCCKMTLEHIPDTARFVAMVRQAVGDRPETVVFFQVPDTKRILREVAFWDIYYEHCSYFGAGSLARMFRGCGFDIINVYTEYADQYLMLEARPGNETHRRPLAAEENVASLAKDVKHFCREYQRKVESWTRVIQEGRKKALRMVVWGSGSKGVSFLTTLGIRDEIEYVVDINPHKHGKYMPGTGQQIVPPTFLQEYRPDRVIVMNSIYQDEIARALREMGLSPELLPL